jgi:hypothetical protein
MLTEKQSILKITFALAVDLRSEDVCEKLKTR